LGRVILCNVRFGSGRLGLVQGDEDCLGDTKEAH
jgi:hypothetical protein